MLVTINGWAVSAPFGSTDPSHPVPHKGIDFAIPIGTPVRSIGDGLVTSITNEGNQSFGLAVKVHLNTGEDVIYGHLSAVRVNIGQVVHKTDVLALSGNTGNSTGPHLHLQVMKNGLAVDPASYLQVASASKESVPWWDLQGQLQAAMEWLGHWVQMKMWELCDSIWHGFIGILDVVLPTLACVGVIWYMVPFFPKHERGAKLTGLSLIVYLFFVLIRGSY